MSIRPNASLRIDNVSKRYDAAAIVRDFSLDIADGEFVALLGPSGCGKTTLLRCITGHIRPDAGRILVGDRDVTELPTAQRNFGMVFQSFALFPHMTALDNVAFPLEARGMKPVERREQARQALQRVQLADLADRYPRQMSGGQQQRVGLARAFVYGPSVLLLDEPLSNLDAKLREEMRFEIKDLLRRLGITAVYVTHDQEEAFTIADRVVVMNHGRPEQVGSPEEIFLAPATEFVARFVGVANILPGRIVERTAAGILIDCGGFKLAATGSEGTAAGTDVRAVIRPTDIRLLDDQPGLGAGIAAAETANMLSGAVVARSYLGAMTEYRVSTGDAVLRIHVPSSVKLTEGQTVTLAIDPASVRVVPATGAAPADKSARHGGAA